MSNSSLVDLPVNFIPEVRKYYNVVECAKEKNTYEQIEVCMKFSENEYSKCFRINLKGMDSINWKNMDSRCRYDPNVSSSKIQRKVEDYIRSVLCKCIPEKAYQINQVGLYKIDGIPVFCTGKDIIMPSGSSLIATKIFINPMAQNMDYSHDISENNAIYAMLSLICSCLNPGQVILSQKILYFCAKHISMPENRPASVCFCMAGLV